MSYPIFILSDASLEQANNTPGQMVAQAKKQGFQSVCLIDINSLSATIKFAKACMAEGVSPLFGVTLTVSCPTRDRALWLKMHRETLQNNALTFNADKHPFDHVTALMEGLPAAKKGKGDSRYQELLRAHLDDSAFYAWAPKSKAAELTKILKAIAAPAPMGQVIFVAKQEQAYSKVMALASWHAKVRRENIREGASAPEALTADALAACIDEVEKVDDVMVVDFWSRDGFSYPLSNGQDNTHIEGLTDSALFSRIHAIGSTEPKNVPSIGKQVIMFPFANYADESQYDEFVIKKAAHRKENIYSPDFVAPESRFWLMPQGVYETMACDVEADKLFYSSIVPFALPLGEIHLPSYKMPVQDVVIYAFEHEGVSPPGRTHTEDAAIETFEAWIKDSVPEGSTLAAYRSKKLNDYCLHRLGMQGLEERLVERFGDKAHEHRDEYVKRFEREFKVMVDMGFSGYFLIEFDFVDFSHRNGIPIGPGRGSAPGSLVVYALRLTDVDPIEYGLQFERFLNEERVSMPDIDTDVGEAHGKGRDEIIAYINEDYQQPGADWPSSSQIANISRYGLKKAISAVRRSMGLSMHFETYQLKALVSLAEEELGAEDPDWEDFNSAECVRARRAVEPMLDMLLRYAEALTGKMETYGVHAGGVVISPTVMTDFTALTCDKDGNYVCQYDKDDIEDAGLIKFDILGLRTLGLIAGCLEQIANTGATPPDMRKIPVNDMKAYEIINQLLLCDIFQLEGEGMSKLVANLQPMSIEEIAVLSALYRPGPLKSGMVDEYVDISSGRTEPTYDHPDLKPVLMETKGCIVYQEQVMSIVRVLANYSLGQADILRRVMGKKKAAEMAKQGAVFMASVMKHWREHFKTIGEKQGFDFSLDVGFDTPEDKAAMTTLGIADCLDENGFFSDREQVVKALSTLLSMRSDDEERLAKRVGDYKYILRYFKDHYQGAIYQAVRHSELDDDLKEEMQTRIYFALSQYVRFNQIFNKVAVFAGYGFNKSHAVVYSVNTYHMAYLKAHFPSAFYASAMTYRKLDTLHMTINEAVGKMNMNLKPACINRSEPVFTALDDKTIRYGLTKLKGVGDPIIEVINERKENGFFSGLIEFVHRMKLRDAMPTNTVVQTLIKAGAFDSLLPKLIIENKQWNGRQYLSFLAENFATIGYSDEEFSPLHTQVDDMGEYEFYCYLSACVKPVFLADTVLSHGSESEGEYDDIKQAFKLKLNENGKAQVLSRLNSSEVMQSGELATSWLVGKASEGDGLTDFEYRYLRLFFFFQDRAKDMYTWEPYLNDALAKSPAESLMEERVVSGAFLTADPLKVLKIRERAEREPPGSLIDGRPVDVSVIDDSYQWQSVTTYGMISDLVTMTVSNENSKSYGQQFIKFRLESRTDSVACSIFGTNAVKKFKKLIAEGQIVMLAGKVDVSEAYGLTIRVAVIKRYFPGFVDGEEDDYQTVPTR